MMAPIEKALDGLERSKAELLGKMRGRTEESLRVRPDAASWSILDVAEHLMKVEDALIEDAMAHTDRRAQAVSVREKVGALVVFGVMRSQIKVKTPPAAKQVIPTDGLGLAEIELCWSDARVRLRELVGSVDSRTAGNAMFHHPVSGRLTAAQGLRFISAHFHHHGYQLKRLGL